MQHGVRVYLEIFPNISFGGCVRGGGQMARCVTVQENDGRSSEEDRRSLPFF